MFYGEAYVTIDTKGRMVIPAMFREELGEKCVLMRGIENCVNVYPISVLEKIKESFGNMKTTEKSFRMMSRRMLGSVQEAEIDAQGRLSVSQPLREFAMLDKDVHVLGTYDHVELWDKNEYVRYSKEECTKEAIEKATEALDF